MKTLKSTISIILFTGVILYACVLYSNYNTREIKKKRKMFCYETYKGSANSVMIIEDLKYKDKLINYYQEIAKGNNPSFEFPLKTLPTDNPVYVMGYTLDSLLAEVVSFYDRGPKLGGNYLRGYVIPETLHEEPIPKTIVCE